MSRQHRHLNQLTPRSNNDDLTLISDDEDDLKVLDSDDEVSFVDIMSTSEVLNLDSTSSQKSPNVRRRALKRRTNVHTQSHPAKMSNLNNKVKNNKENLQLREMLMSQMDLIKQQSADIVRKEKRIRELQKENEKHRNKLKDLALKPIVSFLPPAKPKTVDRAVVTDVNNLVIKFRVSEESPEEQKKPRKKYRTKKNAEDKIVETKEPYFNRFGEHFLQRERLELASILRLSETPQWRVKNIAGSSHVEVTEDMSIEAINKRHSKLEAEEKRRKRWDLQRMREQCNLQRLKARYEKPVSSRSVEVNSSILQDVEKLTHIEVKESIPISSFGFNVPDFGEVDFKLPWFNSTAAKNKRRL